MSWVTLAIRAWTSAKRTGKIRAEGPQSRQNSTTSYPYDDIPAACDPIFGQSASAAALETGGRGLFSGSSRAKCVPNREKSVKSGRKTLFIAES